MIESHPFISFKKNWRLGPNEWFQLGQCQATIKAITRTPISPAYRKKLYLVSLIKGAQATTAIEGNTLSEDEVEQIAEGKSMPESKRYMEQEVSNVLDALQAIRNEIIDDDRSEIITGELLRRFHQLIGKNLGKEFGATPGRFRKRNVVVGQVYRAPDAQHVNDLIDAFCQWSLKEFHYQKGQDFSTAVIQAIVSHVYIAWIHPFDDGNGRTARLLEFYLLLRAGVPDLAAHILSNHYNQTRNEYYRQLKSLQKKKGDLSDFISYALQGFKDGLSEVLKTVQKSQMEVAWNAHVHQTFVQFASMHGSRPVERRRKSLILSFLLDQEYAIDEIAAINEPIRVQYENLSRRTLQRDIDALQVMGLLKLDSQSGKYRAWSGILQGQMAHVRDSRILH